MAPKNAPLPLPTGVRSRPKGLFAALSVAAAQEAVHQLQRVGIVGETVSYTHLETLYRSPAARFPEKCLNHRDNFHAP